MLFDFQQEDHHLYTFKMSSIVSHNPPQLPVAFTHTPGSLIGITKEAIESSKKILDEILNISPQDATFENSVLPLMHEENKLTSKSRMCGLYKAVAVSKELRDASIETVKLWSAYGLEMTLREDRYQMIDAVYKRKESLDTESAYYLSMLHAELLQNGLGLPSGSPRNHFESIKNQSKTTDQMSHTTISPIQLIPWVSEPKADASFSPFQSLPFLKNASRISAVNQVAFGSVEKNLSDFQKMLTVVSAKVRLGVRRRTNSGYRSRLPTSTLFRHTPLIIGPASEPSLGTRINAR